MPANTTRGLPYPLPTEPVTEGAQAIRNLAEAVAPPPPIVSSLPASPYDGQEVLYRALGTNPAWSTLWRFRYSAAAVSALKWELVGGAPLAGETGAGSGVNAQIYQWVGPDLGVGLTGDYILSSWGAGNPDPGWNGFLSPGFGGLPANDNYAIVCAASGSYNPYLWVSGSFAAVRINAGTTVSLYARSTGGAWRWYQRGFSLLPIRVTAAASRPAPDPPELGPAPGPPPPMPEE